MTDSHLSSIGGENSDIEFYTGMHFQTISDVRDAIKAYNIRKNIMCEVNKATSDTFVFECQRRTEEACWWKIRFSRKRRRHGNLWYVYVYNDCHSCSSMS